MKLFVFFISIFLFQDLPYKPTEEFEIKLDYQFKTRQYRSTTEVHLAETRREHEQRASSAVLPYLVLNLHLLKLTPEEVRVRIMDNGHKKVYNRKADTGDVIPIVLGFTADVKDRVSAYEYTVYFQSPDKRDVSRILISVDEDGSFFVNGEKRGRF